ncbi:hypothetical protein BJD12_20835 [Xanthomonas vesicatoria ATCC 35937]|nr:hypothetical protein BI313_23265 [Xanthomonas vesicatoria]APP77262.1 hypothetical protein BJD12_20835 [Xanthomonas vesicatoria ATCC 35937]
MRELHAVWSAVAQHPKFSALFLCPMAARMRAADRFSIRFAENVFLNGEPATCLQRAFSSCASRVALFILASTIECRTIRR